MNATHLAAQGWLPVLGVVFIAAFAWYFGFRGSQAYRANPAVAANRRYTLRFGIAMIVTMGVLWWSESAVHGLSGAPRYLVALAPLIPLFFALLAVVLFFRETDELQRQVTLESLGIAVAATALFSLACGLLESAGVAPLSAWWTWLVLMGSWGIASIARRYYYR